MHGAAGPRGAGAPAHETPSAGDEQASGSSIPTYEELFAELSRSANPKVVANKYIKHLEYPNLDLSSIESTLPQLMSFAEQDEIYLRLIKQAPAEVVSSEQRSKFQQEKSAEVDGMAQQAESLRNDAILDEIKKRIKDDHLNNAFTDMRCVLLVLAARLGIILCFENGAINVVSEQQTKEYEGKSTATITDYLDNKWPHYTGLYGYVYSNKMQDLAKWEAKNIVKKGSSSCCGASPAKLDAKFQDDMEACIDTTIKKIDRNNERFVQLFAHVKSIYEVMLFNEKRNTSNPIYTRPSGHIYSKHYVPTILRSLNNLDDFRDLEAAQSGPARATVLPHIGTELYFIKRTFEAFIKYTALDLRALQIERAIELESTAAPLRTERPQDILFKYVEALNEPNYSDILRNNLNNLFHRTKFVLGFDAIKYLHVLRSNKETLTSESSMDDLKEVLNCIHLITSDLGDDDVFRIEPPGAGETTQPETLTNSVILLTASEKIRVPMLKSMDEIEQAYQTHTAKIPTSERSTAVAAGAVCKAPRQTWQRKFEKKYGIPKLISTFSLPAFHMYALLEQCAAVKSQLQPKSEINPGTTPTEITYGVDSLVQPLLEGQESKSPAPPSNNLYAQLENTILEISNILDRYKHALGEVQSAAGASSGQSGQTNGLSGWLLSAVNLAKQANTLLQQAVAHIHSIRKSNSPPTNAPLKKDEESTPLIQRNHRRRCRVIGGTVCLFGTGAGIGLSVWYAHTHQSGSTPPPPPGKCSLPGITNPVYAHRPQIGQTVPLTGVTVTGNSSYHLTQDFTEGCQFPPGFGYVGPAAELTAYLQGKSINVTKSPFACFISVVQTTNPTCETTGLVASGGDAERRRLHETRKESSTISHEASLTHPAVLAVAQHAAGTAIAVAAEKVRPGSGPMAETVTNMAAGVVSTAITGDLVPLAQTALILVNTRATERKRRLAIVSASAALQAANGNLPGAVVLLAITSINEATSSQTARNAANATGIACLLLTAGTSAPVAAIVSVVNFGMSQAAEAIKPTVYAAEATSAKAPSVPAVPKESWLQWGKRMLGCNSRRSGASPA